jgi:CelD/BcsL family acetyltransferase involved in cellulose biosynthesis
MKVHVVRPAELSPDALALWRQFQAADPALAGPYFAPDFTLSIGRVRGNAFVGILEEDGAILGFFPFQRRWDGLGVPVSGPFSDYHGVIAHRDLSFEPLQLLRGCGLAAFRFTHLVVEQTAFQPYHRGVRLSRRIDVSSGFDAYLRRWRRDSELIAGIGRKQRKLAREVGALRYVARDRDASALRQVIAWKRDQYRRTRAIDCFRFAWTGALLADLQQIDEPEFGGILSTLWAGDQMVAGHMGMRSGGVWHHWFPAYDPNYHRCSPGLILLLKMAESCQGEKCTVIDMGTGDYPYKIQLANASQSVAEGQVGRLSLPVVGAQLRRAVERTAEALPLGPVSAWPGKAFRRIEAFRSFL